MDTSVCWNEINYSLKKSLLRPLRLLVLNQDSYGQLFGLLFSKEFMHAAPCLTFIAAILIFVWRNKKLFEISRIAPNINSKYFVLGQTLLKWMFINLSLTVWLLFQKVLYCVVWFAFSQRNKPLHSLESRLWWVSDDIQPVESTFCLQAENASLLLAETIAGVLCYLVNANVFATKETLEADDSEAHIGAQESRELFAEMESLKEEEQMCQLRCRKGRPAKPYSQLPCPLDKLRAPKPTSDTDTP